MTTHEKSTEKTICPFLSNPLADCYCVRNETVYIDKVLALCGGNFASCDVYRGSMRGGSIKHGKEPK